MKWISIFIKLKLKEIGIFLVIYISSIFLYNGVYLLMSKIPNFLASQFSLNIFNIFIAHYFTGLLLSFLIFMLILILFAVFYIVPMELNKEINNELISFSIIYGVYLFSTVGCYWIGKLIIYLGIIDIPKENIIISIWITGVCTMLILFGIILILYGLYYWIKKNIDKAKKIASFKKD